MSWVEVFGEDVGLETISASVELITDTGNIAGVDIPVFERIEYDEIAYDLYACHCGSIAESRP